MELKELIKKTLIQVACGVDAAKVEMGAMGSSVDDARPLVVRFDVLVTNDDEMKVVASRDNEVVASNVALPEGVHRIAVEVPFTLPVHHSVGKDSLKDKKQSLIEQRIERFTSPFD